MDIDIDGDGGGRDVAKCRENDCIDESGEASVCNLAMSMLRIAMQTLGVDTDPDTTNAGGGSVQQSCLWEVAMFVERGVVEATMRQRGTSFICKT